MNHFERNERMRQRELRGHGVPPHEIMEGVLETLDIEDRARQVFEGSRALRHGANGTFDVENEMIAMLDAPPVEDKEGFPDDEDAPELPPYWDFEGEDGPDALELARLKSEEPEDHVDLVGRGVHLVEERDEVSGMVPNRLAYAKDEYRLRNNRNHYQSDGRKPRKVNRPRPEREARQQRRLGVHAAP